MATLRLVYKLVRYWRCYSLLMFASILSLFLIYASQNDPNMEYFGLGMKYFKDLTSIDAEDVKKLIENNKLDYEFLHPNARFCYSTQQKKKDQKDIQLDDYDLLSDYNEDQLESSRKYSEITLISISQAANFKHRSAARQTWAKRLSDLNAKLVFIIGNPFYETTDNSSRLASSLSKIDEPLAQFDLKDKSKLEKEISLNNDIIQINMPDLDSYKSTKILMAIRWSLTYCLTTKYLFLLSDTAVLNVDQFEKLLKNQNTLKQSLNETIGGLCDLKDEMFSSGLKYFYKNLYKKQQQQQMITTSTKSTTNFNYNKNSNKSKKIENALGRKLLLDDYNGEYCSNSGWLISLSSAKRLWLTALKSQYAMRISYAYVSGFLAFKSNIKRTNLFKSQEVVPKDTSCLKLFSTHPDYLLCNEDFTINSRYTNFIATWNWPTQGGLNFHKL